MYAVNIPSLLAMSVNPGVIALLRESLSYFKRDPDYSFPRFANAMLNAAKGEKIVRHGGRFVLNTFLPPIPSPAYRGLMRAVRDPERPYRSQMLALRSAPVSVFLALTSRCDCSCAHCSANADRVRSDSASTGSDLPSERWLSIIRAFLDMGTAIVGFTGGEPLLREDLEDLVSACAGRAETIVYTNGSFLGRDRALSLAGAGLFACGVSLDYPDRERHDAGRGKKGSFDAALAGIGNARSAGLYAFTQTVAGRSLLKEGALERLYALARESGAQEMRVLEPIPAGRNRGSEAEYLDEGGRAAIRAFQYGKNRRPGLPRVSAFAHTESGEQFGCGAGNQHSYVGASGDLFPCDFLPLSFGSLSGPDVAEKWLAMSDAVGAPKDGCFAIKLKDALASRRGELPLSPGASAELCEACRTWELPGFYRRMQGKR